MDPDHNRSVVTVIGDPQPVEAACARAAELARDAIDLRRHQGAHPRVGALDVLPFVPLRGLEMTDVAASARRAGRAVSRLGIPVAFYGEASEPPGRPLAELRRGGFEAIRNGFPTDRVPDLVPDASAPGLPHPSAGLSCVGARQPLLAWNVYLRGLGVSAARRIASRIRETGGGFTGLRALGLALPRSGRVQVSMNLEDSERRSAGPIYDEIERLAREKGGDVDEVEVVGMASADLAHLAESGRLRAPGLDADRVLETRVKNHVATRGPAPAP